MKTVTINMGNCVVKVTKDGVERIDKIEKDLDTERLFFDYKKRLEILPLGEARRNKDCLRPLEEFIYGISWMNWRKHASKNCILMPEPIENKFEYYGETDEFDSFESKCYAIGMMIARKNCSEDKRGLYIKQAIPYPTAYRCGKSLFVELIKTLRKNVCFDGRKNEKTLVYEITHREKIDKNILIIVDDYRMDPVWFDTVIRDGVNYSPIGKKTKFIEGKDLSGIIVIAHYEKNRTKRYNRLYPVDISDYYCGEIRFNGIDIRNGNYPNEYIDVVINPQKYKDKEYTQQLADEGTSFLLDCVRFYLHCRSINYVP